MITASSCYRLSVVLVCIGIVINSAESLACDSLWSESNMLSWRVLSVRRGFVNGMLAALADQVFATRGTRLLLVSRLAAAVLLMFVARPAAAALLLFTLLVTSAALHLRNQVSGDGSDQMTTIVTAGLFVSAVVSERFATIGFFFIAFQAVLAYSTSGVAKMVSPIWRSGRAVPLILSTDTYGVPKVGSWLSARPVCGQVVTWSVIVFEIAFPLTLLLPEAAAMTTLAIGVLFHAGIAAFMGLNIFVWAFVATYPSLLYVRGLL